MEGPKALDDLADAVERELGGAAVVDRSPVEGLDASSVTIHPRHPDALGVSWIDLGLEVILKAGDGDGGRWELDHSDEHLAFLADVVWSVIAGRVEEVHALKRSRVTVTLADGTRARETGATAMGGCLPLPFWTRWGRKTHYAPYAA